ncbi:MAG: isoprenylcysteine carboxylmethyltransferase family protein [Terriglobales bacterium]
MADLKFYVFLGSQALATLVLLALLAFWPGAWIPQRMVGSVLLVVGMAFVFTARLQLGQSFSVFPRAKKLVTHGLYSKIRNPIYVFGTIAIAGMFLILQIPRLWVWLVVLVLIQVFRARKEARVLEARFGDEYRAYRNHSWF